MPAAARGGKGITLSEAIQEYREYLSFEVNAADTTVTCYVSALRRFGRFLMAYHGRELKLGEITEVDCRRFYYSLAESGLRPRSLRSAMYPVRGLFAMAVERKHIASNPAMAVKLPKKDAAVRRTVSDEEVAQLLAGCSREHHPVRRRLMKAVLSVFIHSALRRQELLDLRVGDINLATGQVLVRSGKGSKDRSFFVSQACMQAVRDWLDVRPNASHDYLFLVDRTRRLGVVGLTRLFREAKALADLSDHDNIKPHALRHNAATRLMRNGADLRSISHLLGHSELETTARYLHTDEAQLQRIAELTALPSQVAEEKPVGPRLRRNSTAQSRRPSERTRPSALRR